METVPVETVPVETVEVEAVNKKEKRGSLYSKRVKIYPKLAHGRWRKIKWIVLAVTLGIYYLLPWVRWDRGPGQPDQAVLLDLPARRFYFFWLEIWPQEVYFLTGLLILSALALFLATALAGRVWCGYSCPQTVWTDLFIQVERLIEGDRAARIRLDKKPWSFDKLWRKTLKHAAWVAIGLLTGGAWVFYFADAPTLTAGLLAFDAPIVAYAFIAGLTFTTYWLGGHMREQVCTYMCPWPRIQAALFDEESLLVTYRDFRGEPRGPLHKNQLRKSKGDCIDCNQCVAVCPMGIDIRDGMQLECIQCALCIDACDRVMDKVGRPRGLIAYDTLPGVEAAARGGKRRLRPIRPRTILYGGSIAVVAGLMLAGLASRTSLDLNLLPDRNPLFVTLSNGDTRNNYTLKLINKSQLAHTYSLTVEGLPRARVSVLGSTTPQVAAPRDTIQAARIFIAAPTADLTSDLTDIALVLTDETGRRDRVGTVFRGPKK
ncbi:MAG: cytochrome c oxidase accessory protein CcoG [Rhodospirillales bacterium]|nr:cytochrome c oxidase accessory protein CcoG [Rhodospirillales bacterium]